MADENFPRNRFIKPAQPPPQSNSAELNGDGGEACVDSVAGLIATNDFFLNNDDLNKWSIRSALRFAD